MKYGFYISDELGKNGNLYSDLYCILYKYNENSKLWNELMIDFVFTLPYKNINDISNKLFLIGVDKNQFDNFDDVLNTFNDSKCDKNIEYNGKMYDYNEFLKKLNHEIKDELCFRLKENLEYYSR